VAIELELQQTNASGRLLPTFLAEVLSRRGMIRSTTPMPQGAMFGQELRLGLAASPTEGASAAFLLDFGGQGARVRGKAHGPSAALFTWAFHMLAVTLKCTLVDVEQGEAITPEPDTLCPAAIAYLKDYEDDVEATRHGDLEDDGAAFLAWLAREEHLALGEQGVAAFAESLPMDDAPALYELLLESDAIDDVFVSERELSSLLARFRARTAPS
jgi:hypothetical protein